MLSDGYPDLSPSALAPTPVAMARTIPSGWYTEPRVHDLDREAVMASAWHYLTAVSSLGRPGDAVSGVVAHDRCVVHFDYYYIDAGSEAAREQAEDDQESRHRIQLEDVEICERVQVGLGSRAYDRGRFSVECEEGVHHFQQQLKASYGRWLAQQGA
ncbi:MAG: SRPBCC family protein [Gemmatimonadota bacterium]|nr:SRPBCC family protein [Gemmatimonadota bacterium]